MCPPRPPLDGPIASHAFADDEQTRIEPQPPSGNDPWIDPWNETPNDDEAWAELTQGTPGPSHSQSLPPDGDIASPVSHYQHNVPLAEDSYDHDFDDNLQIGETPAAHHHIHADAEILGDGDPNAPLVVEDDHSSPKILETYTPTQLRRPPQRYPSHDTTLREPVPRSQRETHQGVVPAAPRPPALPLHRSASKHKPSDFVEIATRNEARTTVSARPSPGRSPSPQVAQQSQTKNQVLAPPAVPPPTPQLVAVRTGADDTSTVANKPSPNRHQPPKVAAAAPHPKRPLPSPPQQPPAPLAKASKKVGRGTLLERARGTLRVVGGPDAGAELRLTGQRVLVGRGRTCDFVLKDIATSRRHIRLVFDGEAYAVHDLQSGNGTLVNEQFKQGSCPLRDGDQIEIGRTTLFLEHPGSRVTTRPGARETHPQHVPPQRPSAPSVPPPIPKALNVVALELPKSPPGAYARAATPAAVLQLETLDINDSAILPAFDESELSMSTHYADTPARGMYLRVIGLGVAVGVGLAVLLYAFGFWSAEDNSRRARRPTTTENKTDTANHKNGVNDTLPMEDSADQVPQKPVAPPRTSPTPQVGAKALASQARAAYAKKRFNTAAKLSQRAANTPSPTSSTPSFQKLSSDYEAVATRLRQAKAADQSDPIAAMGHLAKALQIDKKLGGKHHAYFAVKLSAVAPRAAAKAMALQRYEQAKIAAAFAQQYGAGTNSTIRRVRDALRRHAQDLLKQAQSLRQTDPNKYLATLTTITKIVPPTDPSHKLARSQLASR